MLIKINNYIKYEKLMQLYSNTNDDNYDSGDDD